MSENRVPVLVATQTLAVFQVPLGERIPYQLEDLSDCLRSYSPPLSPSHLPQTSQIITPNIVLYCFHQKICTLSLKNSNQVGWKKRVQTFASDDYFFSFFFLPCRIAFDEEVATQKQNTEERRRRMRAAQEITMDGWEESIIQIGFLYKSLAPSARKERQRNQLGQQENCVPFTWHFHSAFPFVFFSVSPLCIKPLL